MNERKPHVQAPIPLAGAERPRWGGAPAGPSNVDLTRRAESAEAMLRNAETRIAGLTTRASKHATVAADLVADVRAYKNIVDLLLQSVLSAHVGHLESPAAPQRMVLGALLSGHLGELDLEGLLPGAFDAVEDQVAFVSAKAMLKRGEVLTADDALDRLAAAMGGLGATPEQLAQHRERLGEVCGFYLDTEREAVADGQCGEEDSRTPRLLRDWHRAAWIDAFVGALIDVGARRYCYEQIDEIRDDVAELRRMTTTTAQKASRVLEIARVFDRHDDTDAAPPKKVTRL